MKRIRHMKPGTENMLHIETPMGIINIAVGLTDHAGRRVESIEVIPCNYAGEPKRRRSGLGNTRIIEARKARN